MALDPKRKAACRAAILDHLEHVGSREWNTVRDAFPDVPHATFWRLVRTARAELLISKVQAFPAGDDQHAEQDAIIDGKFATDYRNQAKGLREPPRLRDLCGRDAIDPQAVLSACIANANAVVDHARAADGKVRQPKLLLAASKVMADVLRRRRVGRAVGRAARPGLLQGDDGRNRRRVAGGRRPDRGAPGGLECPGWPGE